MLDIANLEVVYNDVILVFRGLSLRVPDGRSSPSSGSNGAGKTTTCGRSPGCSTCTTARSRRGDELRRRRIDGIDTADIVRPGIKQVIEGRRVFAEMTVDENLAPGATHRDREDVAAANERVMSSSPASPSVASRSPDTYPVVSSRCSPSPGR